MIGCRLKTTTNKTTNKVQIHCISQELEGTLTLNPTLDLFQWDPERSTCVICRCSQWRFLPEFDPNSTFWSWLSESRCCSQWRGLAMRRQRDTTSYTTGSCNVGLSLYVSAALTLSADLLSSLLCILNHSLTRFSKSSVFGFFFFGGSHV